MLLRHGVELDTPGLRVAVDHASEDLRMLVDLVFAGRPDVQLLEASYMQLPDLFARGEVDATVWNLDEVQDRLGGVGVDVVPLGGDEVTRELSLRNSSAAVIGRAEGGAKALAAVRDSLDLSLITSLQREVLEGTRLPSY